MGSSAASTASTACSPRRVARAGSGRLAVAHRQCGDRIGVDDLRRSTPKAPRDAPSQPVGAVSVAGPVGPAWIPPLPRRAGGSACGRAAASRRNFSTANERPTTENGAANGFPSVRPTDFDRPRRLARPVGSVRKRRARGDQRATRPGRYLRHPVVRPRACGARKRRLTPRSSWPQRGHGDARILRPHESREPRARRTRSCCGVFGRLRRREHRGRATHPRPRRPGLDGEPRPLPQRHGSALHRPRRRLRLSSRCEVRALLDAKLRRLALTSGGPLAVTDCYVWDQTLGADSGRIRHAGILVEATPETRIEESEGLGDGEEIERAGRS